MAGVKERVEREMHERLYRRPGTAFRSNKAQLLSGFKTAEERQIAKRWLYSQEAYVLGRQAPHGKGKFTRGKTISSGIDDLWQMDLADLTDKMDENDDYRFMLTVIDVFSRWAWAQPVLTKSGADVVKALKAVFHRAGSRRPHKIQTDRGLEFWNKHVKKLLREEGVLKLYSSHDQDTKASLAERFNRTIKEQVTHFMMYYNTNRWIDDLQQIMYSYNNARHSSLGTSPLRVMHMNQSELEDLWQRQYGGMSEKGERQLERDITRGYKVGDLVRVTHLKRTFEKGFMPRWQREVFKVVGSKYMKERLVYKLQDLKGEDVDGWFYPEMLRPHIGAYNRAQVIEKVNKRNRQGVNVKYLGWPEKFNETIPLDEYNRIVQRQHPTKDWGTYYDDQE